MWISTNRVSDGGFQNIRLLFEPVVLKFFLAHLQKTCFPGPPRPTAAALCPSSGASPHSLRSPHVNQCHVSWTILSAEGLFDLTVDGFSGSSSSVAIPRQSVQGAFAAPGGWYKVYLQKNSNVKTHLLFPEIPTGVCKSTSREIFGTTWRQRDITVSMHRRHDQQWADC